MPSPPAQITTQPCSRSHSIWRSSKMRLGSGEGTTRRNALPSGLNVQPRARGAPPRRPGRRSGRIGWWARRTPGRARRPGSSSATWPRACPSAACCRALLDEVADHPLRLGVEDVERVGRHLAAAPWSASAQLDLRPAAGGDHQLSASATGARASQATRTLARWRLLVSSSPAQQGVAAERHDGPHGSTCGPVAVRQPRETVPASSSRRTSSPISPQRRTCPRAPRDDGPMVHGREPHVSGPAHRAGRSFGPTPAATVIGRSTSRAVTPRGRGSTPARQARPDRRQR